MPFLNRGHVIWYWVIQIKSIQISLANVGIVTHSRDLRDETGKHDVISTN